MRYLPEARSEKQNERGQCCDQKVNQFAPKAAGLVGSTRSTTTSLVVFGHKPIHSNRVARVTSHVDSFSVLSVSSVNSVLLLKIFDNPDFSSRRVCRTNYKPNKTKVVRRKGKTMKHMNPIKLALRALVAAARVRWLRAHGCYHNARLALTQTQNG